MADSAKQAKVAKKVTKTTKPKTVKNAVKKLPATPESKLKEIKRVISSKTLSIKRKRARKVLLSKQRRSNIFRAQKYAKKYLMREREVIERSRKAKKNGNIFVPAEPRLAFVIRIRGVNKVAPKVKKVLQLFRLRQINNGTFVRLNKATQNMLRIAQPYIAYGYPSLKTVRQLVYKRGFVKHHGKRIPITDNFWIERKLRKSHKVQCVEDMIYQLYTVGRSFKAVNNFLWPFKLNTPTGGWRKKANHFVDGGDFGNREDRINELVQRMV